MKTTSYLQEIGVLCENENNICVLCNEEVESVDHLMVSCFLVRKNSVELVRWWGLAWVAPSSVSSLLDWWWGGQCERNLRKFWEVIPLVGFWAIWKARNECRFLDGTVVCERLADRVKFYATIWFKYNCGLSNYTIDDFLYRLREIRGKF